MPSRATTGCGRVPRAGIASAFAAALSKRGLADRRPHALLSLVVAFAGLSLAVLTPGAAGEGPNPPVNVSPPTITELAQIGQTVLATPGVWLNLPTSYTYQWRTCDSVDLTCSDIAGATTSTYLLDGADVDDAVAVVVTASNADGSASAASAPVAVSSTPGAPTKADRPLVSGTPEQGYTLTTTNGTWSGQPTGYNYEWLRCKSPGSDCVAIAGATSKSYQLGAADVGKRMRSRVTAWNASGSRSATSAATAVIASDATAPSAPGGLSASAATQSSISVSWSASSDYVGVTGYGRYRNGTLVSSGTGTSYTFTPLTCGTTYTLAVDAYDAVGNRSGKTSVSATTAPCSDTTPPSTPTNLVASAPTQTSLTLSWNASTDNVGVTGYGRYRNGTLVTSGTGTSYTFTGLACGTTYTLAVDAYDAAGNRSAKGQITASTSACTDNTPPSVPQGQRITGTTQSSISMAWDASTDNVGVAGYRVYRNDVLVASTQQLSYTYTGLQCGTTYTVGLEAYDAAGNASNRAEAQGPATTAACSGGDTQAPTTPGNLTVVGASGNSISLAWSASLDNVGVAGYGVYSATSLVATTNGTSYTVSGLNCGTSYSLAVDAYDAAGNRSAKASLSASTSPCSSDTTPPSVPTGLAASGATQNSVTVAWNASSDNVAVTGYGRYRNGSLVSSGTGTSYTFSGLSCGTSYTLAVDAYDAAGNRSTKAQLGASTAACTPSGSGTANLWIDANGGSCTRQATPGAYVDTQACGSVSAAYTAASAGDTILVAGGTYGRQVVPSGSKALTIRNAPNATPVFGTTTVDASNITFAGITVQRNDDPGGNTATLEAKGSSNTFDGVNVDTKNMPFRQGIYANGDNNTFKNGSTYNVVDEKGALVGGTGVTFDNFDFHDVRVTDPGVHNECVYSIGPNLTVRNSHFWNCATMDLFITRGDWWGQPLYGGITLENNIFEHATMEGAGSWHYYSLGINGGIIQEMRNWRVVNNTFETEVSGDGTPAPGTIWANNVGSWGCYPQATFVNNVGMKCSASDKAVSPAASCGQPACGSPTTAAQGWVNPAGHDFHLTAGAPAIDAASSAYAPATDKDRNTRVGPPDAGAYEYR